MPHTILCAAVICVSIVLDNANVSNACKGETFLCPRLYLRKVLEFIANANAAKQGIIILAVEFFGAVNGGIAYARIAKGERNACVYIKD